MGLLDKNVCPKCGQEYSILKSSCPNCGARKQLASRRTPAGSDTTRRGSPAQARQQQDSRWQMIFGLCLVAAVIIAVIILIVTTVNGGYEKSPGKTSPSPVTESTEPTPEPTPTPTPTPTVESIKITFLGEEKTGFTMTVGGPDIQLKATVLPIEITDAVEWKSDKPEVCTVSAEGLVKAVSAGSANVTATLYGITQTCQVVVR